MSSTSHAVTHVPTGTRTITFFEVCSSTPLPGDSISLGTVPFTTRAFHDDSVINVTFVDTVVSYRTPSCRNYHLSDIVPIEPNPDVAGIGVVTAFLVTAWVSLIFIVWAYFSERIPATLLGQLDRIFFKGEGKHCDEPWKKTIDKVVLVFSDQQLVTGLAIITAGFLEAYNNDLGVHHWQIVVYLAWLSSTVHLTSLSLLKEQLEQRRALQYLRIFGMVLLFTLLLVALTPQLSTIFVELPYAKQGTAVRCFLSREESYGLYRRWMNPDAAISYGTLCVGHVWKLCQVIPTSHLYIRRWGFAIPALFLERQLKLHMNNSSRKLTIRLYVKFLTFWYIILLLITEILDSFLATLLLLLGTLSWGTARLAMSYVYTPTEVRIEELKLSFGQLLPLFLLCQPLAAIIEYLEVKWSKRTHAPVPPNSKLMVAKNPPTTHSPDPTTPTQQILKQNTIDVISNHLDPQLSCLSKALKQSPLLSVDEKSKKVRVDPIVTHIYRSKLFKCLLFMAFSVAVGFMVLMIFVVTSSGPGPGVLDNVRYNQASSDFAATRYFSVVYGLGPAIGCIPLVLAFSLPFSKTLR